MGSHYKIRDNWVINENSGQLGLYNPQEGQEIQVDFNLLEIIRIFSIPCTVESAWVLLSHRFDIEKQLVNEAVQFLLEKNILETYSPSAKRFIHGKGGMFQSDVVELSECLKGDWADIAFIGMPYDLNVTYKPGTRFGPSYLRRVSGAVFQQRYPQGAYHPVKGREILRNTRMVDIGDIQSIVFSRNGAQFDILEESVYRLLSNGIFPVTLGGDHSISLACINAAARKSKNLGIIQLDAHADFGLVDVKDWRASVHHGNFMDKVILHQDVKQIIQIGVRQIGEQQTHPKVRQWAGKSILNSWFEWVEHLNPDLDYYITFDVDVIDPSVISHTGTPLPNGFNYAEIASVLVKIAKEVKNIIGFDVVELIPSESDVEGVMISSLIIEFLSELYGV